VLNKKNPNMMNMAFLLKTILVMKQRSFTEDIPWRMTSKKRINFKKLKEDQRSEDDRPCLQSK